MPSPSWSLSKNIRRQKICRQTSLPLAPHSTRGQTTLRTDKPSPGYFAYARQILHVQIWTTNWEVFQARACRKQNIVWNSSITADLRCTRSYCHPQDVAHCCLVLRFSFWVQIYLQIRSPRSLKGAHNTRVLGPPPRTHFTSVVGLPRAPISLAIRGLWNADLKYKNFLIFASLQ